MNRKKIILLVLLSFFKVIYSQNYSELETDYFKFYNSNNLTKAIVCAKKLKDISMTQNGVISFEFSKSCYYLGQIEMMISEEVSAIQNFEKSKIFFKTENLKKCGSYHNLIDKLAYCYFNIQENDSALKNSMELMKLEGICKSLNDIESKSAYILNANIQLKMSAFQKNGIEMLEGFINSDIEFINSNYDKPSFNEIKENYLNIFIDNIESATEYYQSKNNLEDALSIIEKLKNLKMIIDSPLLNYRILELKTFNALQFGDYEKVQKFATYELELISKYSFFKNDSVSYFYKSGCLYERINNYNSAVINYEKALKFFSKDNIKKHNLPKQTIYSALSLCLAKNGDYARSNLIRDSERSYLVSINNLNLWHELSIIFFKTTNYINAGSYKEAHKLSLVFNDLLKKNRSDSIEIERLKSAMLNLNSKIFSNLGLWSEWRNNIHEELNSGIEDVTSIFAFASEEERQKYIYQINYLFEDLNSNTLKANKSKTECSDISYNYELFFKCILLEANSLFEKSVYKSNNEPIIKLYNDLKLKKKSYSKLNSESNAKDIAKLEFDIDELDESLSRKISFYADYKKNFSLTWKDVQSNLSDNEAAVEFARYYDNKDSAYHYLALIVKQGVKYPALIKLCSEEELKKYSTESELKEIYDLVWKPLLPSMSNIKTIYYSPSGLLNNIPFQALFKEENRIKEYIMDRFTLHQLTSTRYLALDLKKKEQEPIGNSIALFGGINYDDLPNASADQINKEESINAAIMHKDAIASKRGSDNDRSGVKYLPGTKTEVNNITQLLKNKNWNVETVEGINASENKIKSLSGNNSKKILHIATHGFAYTDKEDIGSNRFQVAVNPMIRSGLYFAGANLTLKDKGDSLLTKTNEDAVLTAFELSQLDLSKTKLAVLSACETGKGAIQGSEGTFGLKRALKLAGVDNMIVSLWEVPDDATMEMMTLFYTELAKTKLPVPAFEFAQKTMRLNHPDKPKKWAGFVFVR